MRNPLNRDMPATLRRLETQPGRYDFYAAVRQIECAHPSLPRIGKSVRPQDDALRFGQNYSLAFEPGMIASYAQGHAGASRMTVNFFGLCGANGPMPVHLTEYVRDRVRNAADPTLSRFLDIFHHRMTSLMYRAWATAQPTVSFDRPQDDRFAAWVGSCIGIGSASLRQRDAVNDSAKLHYAGRLSSQVRNAAGLVAILTDYFRLPFGLSQFVGHWMHLPDDGHCILRGGHDAQAQDGSAVLGQNTVLGKRVWNCQHKFRVVIGPLALTQFRQMLPGGASANRLLAWVRNYAGLALDWDVNLILKKDQVPRLRLGRQAQLGWTTWLGSRAPQVDDSQLTFSPNHHKAAGESRRLHT